MRSWIVLIVIGLINCSGCTHLALERRTVKQASTLTDLQYKQVLDNLAMFACNKDALAWHVKIKGGTVQIADQGSGAFGADIATAVGGEVTRLLPAAGAQRGIVNQWDVDPAVDADELEHLGLVYRKAVNPNDGELWNEMHEAICNLSVRFSLLPQKETIQRILWKKEGHKEKGQKDSYPTNVPAPDKIHDYPGAKRIVEVIAALEQEKNEDKENFAKHQISVLSDLLFAEGVSETEREKKLKAWKAEALGERKKTGRMVQLPTKRRGGGASKPLDDTSATMLLILTGIHASCPAGYLPSTDVIWETERNPGLIDQAEDKIKKFEDLLEKPEFNTPWLSCSAKRDVPKCACYVGRYCKCGCDCYVWVTPENVRFLRAFTLAVLTMAPREAQDILGGRGAAFSPSIR